MSLLTDASLVLTPNAYKASKLYSVIPSNGNGDFTATRATTATRINSSGLVESVALNVPRIDYSLGGCPNILLEPQRTNLALQSSSFDNASWSKFGSSVTANSTTSPSGIADADTLIESATNATHLLEQSVAVTAVNHTLSCYVKAVSGSTRNVGILFNITGKGVLLNPSTGAVVTYFNTTAADVSISNVGNGWFRVSVTALTAAITEKIRIYLGNGTTWTAPYLGDGTSGVYIWGAQFEVGAYATSYIPTTTASVTRNADVLQLNGASALIGQTQGTMFCEMRIGASENISITRYIVSISDGTANNRIDVYRFNNTIQYDHVVGNVVQFTGVVFNITNFNTTLKLAIRYSLNNVKAFVNGVLVNTDTTALIPACNQVNVGSNRLGAPTTIYGGLINETALFTTALTDTQLAQLTTL